MDKNERDRFFAAIGLFNMQGSEYWQKRGKHRQIEAFAAHILKAVHRLSKKRTLTLVDCACGRSYLSFYANHCLRREGRVRTQFVCIDRNRHVICRSGKVAKSLGFENMRFLCTDIADVKLHGPDIVYSLHACNTATDMTIAKGIQEHAQYILTVSCCQHFIREHMRGHPFTAMTKHNVYKERIADMVSDTMRSLILQAMGYKTELFDYVSTRETPKNVMLRAVKGPFNQRRAQQAMREYEKLKELFDVEPKAMEFLKGGVPLQAP